MEFNRKKVKETEIKEFVPTSDLAANVKDLEKLGFSKRNNSAALRYDTIIYETESMKITLSCNCNVLIMKKTLTNGGAVFMTLWRKSMAGVIPYQKLKVLTQIIKEGNLC